MILRVRRCAVCPVCGRRITLSVTAGTLRRHMSARGVICQGARKTPQEAAGQPAVSM